MRVRKLLSLAQTLQRTPSAVVHHTEATVAATQPLAAVRPSVEDSSEAVQKRHEPFSDIHIPGKYKNMIRKNNPQRTESETNRPQRQIKQKDPYQEWLERPSIVMAAPSPPISLHRDTPQQTPGQLRRQAKRLYRVEALLLEAIESPQFSKWLKPHLWRIKRFTLSKDERTCTIWWTPTILDKKIELSETSLQSVLDEAAPLLRKTMMNTKLGWHAVAGKAARSVPSLVFRKDVAVMQQLALETAFERIAKEMQSKNQQLSIPTKIE